MRPRLISSVAEMTNASDLYALNQASMRPRLISRGNENAAKGLHLHIWELQ